jgi:hypothetical protein
MRRLSFLVAAVVVAACTQSGSVAPTSAPPSPGLTPSLASPSAAPSPSAGVAISLPKGTLAVVAVETLDVMAAPSPSAELLDLPEANANPLSLGAIVLIVGEPLEAEGARWYPVGFGLRDGNPPVGWVTAGTSTTPSLRVADSACPGGATLAIIAGLSAIQRLACYGSTSLHFTAHQASTPPGIGFLPPECPDVGPAWLACEGGVPSWVNSDGTATGGPGLMLYFDPATGIKPTRLALVGKTGPTYDIRGHFNDPAAADCTSGADPGSREELESWLGCATKFVVERLARTS